MLPMLEQLHLGLADAANDHLEELLAEEIAREAAEPGYGITIIRSKPEGRGDAR